MLCLDIGSACDDSWATRDAYRLAKAHCKKQAEKTSTDENALLLTPPPEELCCRCTKGTFHHTKYLFSVDGPDPAGSTVCSKCCQDLEVEGKHPYYDGDELKGQ